MVANHPNVCVRAFLLTKNYKCLDWSAMYLPEYLIQFLWFVHLEWLVEGVSNILGLELLADPVVVGELGGHQGGHEPHGRGGHAVGCARVRVNVVAWRC